MPEKAVDPIAELAKRLLAEGKQDLYHEIMRIVDRVVLGEVMERCHGNQLRAAKLLGLSRMTLRSKLHELGLKSTWKEPTTDNSES